MKKAYTKIIIISAIIICVIALSGCESNTSEPSYSYTITIIGLNGTTTDNNTTEILIPVPIVDNKPLFKAETVKSRSKDWSITPVDTEYGKMLALTNNNKNLSNIYIEYTDSIDVDSWFHTMDYSVLNKSLTDAPFNPVSNNTTKYSIPIGLPATPSADYYHWVRNYSSYINLNKNITSATNNNNSIEIRLYLFFCRGIGHQNNSGGINQWSGIRELIPQGVNGYIPVNVSIWDSNY